MALDGFARSFCILHSAFCLRFGVALGGGRKTLSMGASPVVVFRLSQTLYTLLHVLDARKAGPGALKVASG